MIEVHLRGGQKIVVDADKVQYSGSSSQMGLRSVQLLKGSTVVGEFVLSEFAGWNQAATAD